MRKNAFAGGFRDISCERRRIAGEHVEILRWHGSYADTTCPLGHQARLFVDRVPTLSCRHERCAADVAEINFHLREAVWEAEGVEDELVTWEPTPEQVAEARFRRELRRIRTSATRFLLPETLQGPALTAEQLASESTPRLSKATPATQQDLLLQVIQDAHRLWQFDPVVWIGELGDSGDPSCRGAFRPVTEWRKRIQRKGALGCYYPQICPASFRAGCWERAAKNVTHRRFLVYESDQIELEEQLKVIGWLRTYFDLRAVIYSGGKSLHCWLRSDSIKVDTDDCHHNVGSSGWRSLEGFKQHGRKSWIAGNAVWREMRRIEAMLKGLGADPGMFASQAATTRFAGVQRLGDDGNETGREQRLLYVKTEQGN